MPMKNHLISLGFLIAGVINIAGALGTSMVFTNPHLAEADPTAMSNFGLAGIILWGCAYIATARHWRQMKWLVAVFCIEKVLYAAHWVFWILDNRDTLGSIFETDFMAGLFLSVYGPNDMLFAAFFAFAFARASRSLPS